jgi:hypothetical protein
MAHMVVDAMYAKMGELKLVSSMVSVQSFRPSSIVKQRIVRHIHEMQLPTVVSSRLCFTDVERYGRDEQGHHHDQRLTRLAAPTTLGCNPNRQIGCATDKTKPFFVSSSALSWVYTQPFLILKLMSQSWCWRSSLFGRPRDTSYAILWGISHRGRSLMFTLCSQSYFTKNRAGHF